MWHLFRLLTGVPQGVRDRATAWLHAQSMEIDVNCQHCSRRLQRHCPNCNWLECTTCQMLIGLHNTIFYGAARERFEQAQRRQNGT